VTSNLFDDMKMYCEAGLEEYHYMQSIESVEELKKLLDLSGYDVGPGKCIWADHFAIQSLSTLLSLVILIVDEQSIDGKPFICILPEDLPEDMVTAPFDLKFCLLQRTRRQHFNPIVYDQTGLISAHECPQNLLKNWDIPDNLMLFLSSQNRNDTTISSSNEPAKGISEITNQIHTKRDFAVTRNILKRSSNPIEMARSCGKPPNVKKSKSTKKRRKKKVLHNEG